LCTFSFFNTIKYDFLRARVNRRLDNMLRMLIFEVLPYFENMDNLQAANRIRNTRNEALERMRERGQRLLAKGEQNCF